MGRCCRKKILRGSSSNIDSRRTSNAQDRFKNPTCAILLLRVVRVAPTFSTASTLSRRLHTTFTEEQCHATMGAKSGQEMSKHTPLIGILSPVTEPGMRDWWNSLREGLNALGYVEGRNIDFVWRFGDGKFERLPHLASELAELNVDIIVPATPPAIR